MTEGPVPTLITMCKLFSNDALANYKEHPVRKKLMLITSDILFLLKFVFKYGGSKNRIE